MTPPPTPGPPDSVGLAPGRRPPMVLVFAVTVTGILANTLVAPALPAIVSELGVSEGLAGLVITAATVPGIAIAPAIGVLADRYGRRRVLLPCLVIFGVAGGLAALAPSFGLLLLARVGQGIGSAGLINLAVVLIADHWDGAERARRIGWNAAVLTASIAVVPPLGGLLASAGWRATFLPYLLALPTAAAVLRWLPKGQTRADVSLGDQVRGVRPALADPVVRRTLLTGVFAFVLIFGLVLTILPLHYQGRFGLEPASIGLMMALPAVPSTVVALQLGRLRRRFSAPGLVRTGLALFAVAFAGVALAPGLAVVGLATAVYGAGEGMLIPNLQDRVAAAAPDAQRGAVIAVWVGFVRLGQAVGPAAAGALLAPLGAATLFGLGAAAAVAAALAAGGAGGRAGIPAPAVAER